MKWLNMWWPLIAYPLVSGVLIIMLYHILVWTFWNSKPDPTPAPGFAQPAAEVDKPRCVPGRVQRAVGRLQRLPEAVIFQISRGRRCAVAADRRRMMKCDWCQQDKVKFADVMGNVCLECWKDYCEKEEMILASAEEAPDA